MLILLASLMAGVAFVILMRLLWVSARPSKSTTIVTLAAAALVLGLGVLAATGRLHWIAAVFAAMLPFLRRLPSLLRYLPLFRGAFSAYQQTRNGAGGFDHSRNDGEHASEGESMDVDKACDVLGLDGEPTRAEVIAAHRRLMQKIHPDRGGSTYLAQQLNEAKRVLLKHLA